MNITKSQLDESLEAIESLSKNKDIDKDTYHKCLVALSYDYLQILETQVAFRLIAKIPEAYFRDVQLQQMAEDEAYKKVVVLLSYKLIQLGVVESDQEIKPTQALGLA